MPNFDEISQYTAEIKLLPVTKNGWPPYWDSISGFDFDLRPACHFASLCQIS